MFRNKPPTTISHTSTDIYQTLSILQIMNNIIEKHELERHFSLFDTNVGTIPRNRTNKNTSKHPKEISNLRHHDPTTQKFTFTTKTL